MNRNIFAYTGLYQYVSHSISNSYEPVCLVFACQILHAPTCEYALTGFSYMPVSASMHCTMQRAICNYIQAHMHWYGSSYLPVSACICLYLPVSACLHLPLFACICRQQQRCWAATEQRQRCSCGTFAAQSINVHRAGRAYPGRLPFTFWPEPDSTSGSHSGSQQQQVHFWYALKFLGAVRCSGLRGSYYSLAAT